MYRWWLGGLQVLKLLEIQPGICVNTDRIDGVSKIDDFTSKVYMGPHVFESNMSYENLVLLIKGEDTSRDEQLLNIAKTQTFFAG